MNTPGQLLAAIEAKTGALPARVRAAFLAVDRARFVRECDRAWAWENVALPLDTPHGRRSPSVDAMVAEHGSLMNAMMALPDGLPTTISQPLVYAMAFLALGIAEGQRWLEFGCATGYGAALASQVVGPSGRVTTVDVDPHLVREASARLAESPNVTVVHDDGLARADLVAAHERVWLTFAVPAVPDALLDALGEGARLLAPVGPAGGQTLTRFQRREGAVVRTELAPVGFIAARARIEA